jgi:hypothetical protein
MHQVMDKTGAKAFNNEDFFKGSSAVPDVHIHINAVDSSDVHRFFSEHAETVAGHIHRVFMDQMGRAAVV